MKREQYIGMNAHVAVKALLNRADELNARLAASRTWYLGAKKRYGEARL